MLCGCRDLSWASYLTWNTTNFRALPLFCFGAREPQKHVRVLHLISVEAHIAIIIEVSRIFVILRLCIWRIIYGPEVLFGARKSIWTLTVTPSIEVHTCLWFLRTSESEVWAGRWWKLQICLLLLVGSAAYFILCVLYFVKSYMMRDPDEVWWCNDTD